MVRKFLGNLGQNFQKFMIGRYGVDQLNTALVYTTLGLSIIGLFFNNIILTLLMWVSFFIFWFRCLSKNKTKRYKENEKYLIIKNHITRKTQSRMNQVKDKTHKYYSCPQCKQTIRVPKGKGKIEISCPKCRTTFIKKT